MIGNIRGVGMNAIAELRATIPADTQAPAPEPEIAASVELPEPTPTSHRRERPKRARTVGANGVTATQAAPVPAQAPVELPAAPNGVAQADTFVVAAPEANPMKRRRARRVAAPLHTNVDIIDTPGLNDDRAQVRGAHEGQIEAIVGEPQPVPVPSDPTLEQLTRLWRELHPHARRAVVLFASELAIEVGT